MDWLIERVGFRRLVVTLTVLLVLCLAGLGVLIDRIATLPPVAAESGGGDSGGGPGSALGKFTPLATPQPAPALTLADRSGKSVALADLRGRLVLINLWATWCGPCVREMPSLARLQARLKTLDILAVSEDRTGEAAVAPFLAKLKLRGLAIYLDPKDAATHAFHVDGLPTSILIGRDGRILGRLEGAADWDSDKMVSLLQHYAGQDTARE